MNDVNSILIALIILLYYLVILYVLLLPFRAIILVKSSLSLSTN